VLLEKVLLEKVLLEKVLLEKVLDTPTAFAIGSAPRI
jgi:hypothetical protein